MKHARMKFLSIFAVGVLASAAVVAQTGNSGGSPGVNPGGPSSGAPRSGTVNPRPADRLPGSAADTPAPAPGTNPPPSYPSVSAGTSMSRGTDDAMATPEDRATCAALSGTAKADCVADTRKQREARSEPGRGRM